MSKDLKDTLADDIAYYSGHIRAAGCSLAKRAPVRGVSDKRDTFFPPTDKGVLK